MVKSITRGRPSAAIGGAVVFCASYLNAMLDTEGTVSAIITEIAQRSVTVDCQGLVIDLMNSGEGLSNCWGQASGTIDRPPSFPPAPSPPGNWNSNPPVPYDPVITFTPGGSVGHVGTTAMMRPTGPIYLLLGHRELVPDVAIKDRPGEVDDKDPEDKNIYDSDLPATEPENLYLRNFWISIGHQTGLVTTAENTTNLGPGVAGFMQSARAIARTAQSVGGK